MYDEIYNPEIATNTAHLYQHYALVLTVPDGVLASAPLSITSKIISREKVATQHSDM